MFFYVVFISSLLFISGRWHFIRNHHFFNRKDGLFVSIVILILFASMRFNIGYDWNIYLSKVYPTFNVNRIQRFEPLNKLIFYIARLFTSPWLYFTLYAILTYGFLFFAIKENSYSYFESLIIYVSLFYLVSLSTMRQSVAVSIVFWGYRYVKEKKLLKYFLTCFLAFLFHKTALIGIMIYFIFWLNPIIYVSFILFFVLFFKKILFFFLGGFASYFLQYINGGIEGGGNSVKLFYLMIVIYCSILVFIKRKKDIKEIYGLLNNVILGGIMPFILGGHTGIRLGAYFFIQLTLLIPAIHMKKKISYRVIFLVIFYLFFFLYLYTTVKNSGSTEYVPYRFYFLESLDQELL